MYGRYPYGDTERGILVAVGIIRFWIHIVRWPVGKSDMISPPPVGYQIGSVRKLGSIGYER